MKNKIRAAVYGFAVGDAFGVPYEFKMRDTFKCLNIMIGGGSHNQCAGTWSDDTSMVLATMEALSKNSASKLNQLELIMRNFVRWYVTAEFTAHNNTFDIGGITQGAIRKFMRNKDIRSCGMTSEYANGNGALMRILPFVFLPYDEKFIDAVAALTHNTSRSKFACEVYVRLGQKIIDNTYDIFDPYFDMIRSMPRHQIRSTGYVLDSLVAALWSFLTTDDYEECIMTAVELGEDTDTIAALAGGLAGLYYGYNAIPENWIKDLENKELIDNIIEKFTKTNIV